MFHRSLMYMWCVISRVTLSGLGERSGMKAVLCVIQPSCASDTDIKIYGEIVQFPRVFPMLDHEMYVCAL